MPSFISCSALSVLSLTMLVGTAGCGGEDKPSADPQTGGETGSGGSSGGAGGSGGGAGGGGGAVDGPDPLVLSWVAETTPGQAPAMLRYHNDTDELISLHIGDGQAYAFVEVEAFTTSDYLPAGLTDVDTTVLVGLHTDQNFCVNIRLSEQSGPNSLEPGQAYTFRTEELATETFLGEVIQDPAPAPFVGTRLIVKAPGPGGAGLPVSLELTTSNGPVLFEGQFDSLTPSPYQAIDGSGMNVTNTVYINRSGQRFESDESIDVSGAQGYTLTVGTTEAANAVQSVTLTYME